MVTGIAAYKRSSSNGLYHSFCRNGRTQGKFLSAVTRMRRRRPNIPRKLTATIVKFSTIWKPCVSITATKLFSYAVMKLDVSDLRYIIS